MGNFGDLDEKQLAQTRDSLWNRQYYLFTGSGVSIDSIGPMGNLNSASILRDKLCDLHGISKNRSLQQAYGLLDPDGVQVHITEPYHCKEPGPSVTKLASYPWQRVYTLNVDNCLELATRRLPPGPGQNIEPEIKHFIDDFSELSPLNVQSIIHLHGIVDRPNDGYVFSHSEYAKLIARPNAWMLTLSQLIRSEPFIVAGTTLDEFDFTYYVEQRNPNFARADVAPSILIEPYPDKLTIQLCDKHELYLFVGTTLEFFTFFENKYGPPPEFWRPLPPDGMEAVLASRHDKIAFSSSFELVPKAAVKPGRIAPFLLGSEINWGDLEARADIAREITPRLLQTIQDISKEPETRVLILLDDPGAGKSALLKRLAFQLARLEKNTFFFSGREIIDQKSCASILEAILGKVFIFIDDWADHSSFFAQVLPMVARNDIVLIGTERAYRRPYIENGLADEKIKIIETQLGLQLPEARRLIRALNAQGLSSIPAKLDNEIASQARQLKGEPISIASCRIQNRFYTFDRIVSGILDESPDEDVRIFATVGIARFCYSGGVQRSVLYDALKSSRVESLISTYAKLPIIRSELGSEYLIPARSVVADRVIAVLQRKRPELLAEIFVSLANALSARVNRAEINARTPAARLSGSLMDFDRIVKRFIDGSAEEFYDAVKDNWSWNSRYWEQCALLKFDRYLAEKSDRRLLDEAIQNARYAYSIEHHPFSLTTLAKMLFGAIGEHLGANDELFDEGWQLINQSIEIESKWVNIKATAFVVCFNGVMKYVRSGGILDGTKTDRLRDILSITHRRNLRDPTMVRFRDQIVAEVV